MEIEFRTEDPAVRDARRELLANLADWDADVRQGHPPSQATPQHPTASDSTR